MDAQDDPDVLARYAWVLFELLVRTQRKTVFLSSLRFDSIYVGVNKELRYKSCTLRAQACCLPSVRDFLVYIDVTRRYINDCRNTSLYNVAFRKLPEERKALVVALKDINPGDEIFVDYGR